MALAGTARVSLRAGDPADEREAEGEKDHALVLRVDVHAEVAVKHL